VDEIGAVSGKLFLKYFLPDLNEFSRRYGGLGIHCCANARHQWQHFLKVQDLRLLNINQPTGTLREAYAYFARTASQWHYDQAENPPDPLAWMQDFPDEAHAVVDVGASTREEAQRISSEWMETYG
jgi:hypothetical protein